MSDTQQISVTVIGNIDKSVDLEITDGQTILQALQDHIAVDSVSFRLNGHTANGEETVKAGDRVTAIPKVKAGFTGGLLTGKGWLI